MNTNFKYKYNILLDNVNETDQNVYELDIPLNLSHLESSSIEELSHRIINMFKTPKYIENDLTNALINFKTNACNEHFNNEIKKLIDKKQDIDIDECCKGWEDYLKDTTSTYSEHISESDEQVFGLAYHKLVHSSALQMILDREYSYAQCVRECLQQQNKQLSILSKKQMHEMSKAIEHLNQSMSNDTNDEYKINELSIKHFNAHSYLHAQCCSEINTIKDVQKRIYRTWIMELFEQQQFNNTNITTPSLTTATTIDSDYNNDMMNENDIEESFTIHLGSQMKQMYNIRLISTKIQSFFNIYNNNSRKGSQDDDDSNIIATDNPDLIINSSAQRLQTAMALYSNDLCGIILLTDNNMGFTSITKEFTNICQESTEYHFLNVDDQMELIGECVRNNCKLSNTNNTNNGSNGGNSDEWQTILYKNLKDGDIYITTHSNLSKVHVVFHLMYNSTCSSTDINSRHNVILGIRNILKLACSNNITTLTIPLLLQNEMSEEMTVQWCTKRAELIFKCVKGFMIEMASWGGSELKNLQFIIPKGISTSVFTSLATMLTTIFKLSNPVVFKKQ
ncbi:protein C12orf4 homolog [Chrysoperla carnea]|uniref:protein C12orf4 homolog n=1 Tax=Chrysoperla carnea TaxID=189513 RepID=UPI001D07C670|nr:protein C12orf4 homolog [Chrysoperla carnea]